MQCVCEDTVHGVPFKSEASLPGIPKPCLLETNCGDQVRPHSKLLLWLNGTAATKAVNERKSSCLSPLGDRIHDHSRTVGSIWKAEFHHLSPWTLVTSASPHLSVFRSNFHSHKNSSHWIWAHIDPSPENAMLTSTEGQGFLL